MIKLQSLRTKLVLVFFLLGICPLLLLGMLAYNAVNHTHRQDVATMEVQLVGQKSAEIQKFYNDVSGLFEIHVGYDQTSVIQLSDQQFLLGKLIDDNPDILEATFVDTLGQETAKSSRIAQADLYPLQNINQLKSYQIAKSGGHYVGPVEQTLSGPVVFISGPVFNRNGQVIMVVMGEISLKSILKMVNLSILGNEGYLYLADQRGTVIASGESSLKNKNLFADVWLEQIIKGRQDDGLDQTDDRLSSNNQEVLSAGRLIPTLNWSLVAEWPKTDAFAVVQDIQNQLVEFLLVTVIGMIILGWLIGRSILKPITTLAEAATKVGNGDFSASIKIKTGDELEELGNAFNSMTAGLKRLAELKEEFVFIAAHELRTPVTAIKGYLSMISGGEAGPLAKPIGELLDKVVAANSRLVQLVEDLLQVARNDAGRLTIDLAPTDLAPIVQGVVSELVPLAKDKKQQVVYQAFGSPLPLVLADGERTKEVLVNLIGNAIKYTKTGGMIIVKHELTSAGLVTHVSDNGIGMSEEERKKLFEKFYRVKNSDTSKISGTGLGLFIVKQIIEKMNGKIWVNSQKNQGTTFSFALVLSKSE